MALRIFSRGTTGAIEKGLEAMMTKGSRQAAAEGSTVLSDALEKLSPEARAVAEKALRYGKLGNVGHRIFTIEAPCHYDSTGRTISFYDMKTGKWLKNKTILSSINGERVNLPDAVRMKNLSNQKREFYRCDTFDAPESYKNMFNFDPEYNECPSKNIHQLREYDGSGLTYYHNKVSYDDKRKGYIGGWRQEIFADKTYDIKNGTYHKRIDSNYSNHGIATEGGRMSVLGEGSKTWRGFQLFPEYAGFYKKELGRVDCIG